MKADRLSVGRFPSSAFANNVAVAPHCSGYARCWTLRMPIKPNGALCAIKEQIVEDLVSGLILQFECQNGRTRLVIAGSALPFGNQIRSVHDLLAKMLGGDVSAQAVPAGA